MTRFFEEKISIRKLVMGAFLLSLQLANMTIPVNAEVIIGTDIGTAKDSDFITHFGFVETNPGGLEYVFSNSNRTSVKQLRSGTIKLIRSGR